MLVLLVLAVLAGVLFGAVVGDSVVAGDGVVMLLGMLLGVLMLGLGWFLLTSMS